MIGSTNKKIDLHMHSNISSDGEYAPDKLMEMCYEAGIGIVALADHNSLAGIPRAKKKAEELGMTFIPAVELDCTIDGINVHLLGYFVEDKFGWFRNDEISIFNQELECGKKMISQIEQLGIKVNKTRIKEKVKNGVITGELIAEVALADERNDHNKLLKPYRIDGDRSDNPYVNFYWDFCSQGKPAYIPRQFPTFEETVKEIKRVGGMPVLAHPGANIGCNKEILKKMKKMGMQGVEVYSSYHNSETVRFYEAAADDLGLIKTVGSDFHGKTKPSIKLGCMRIPKEEMLTELSIIGMKYAI